MEYIVIFVDACLDRELVEEIMDLASTADDFEDIVTAAFQAQDAVDLIWLCHGAETISD